jgi:hypothetical protein
MIRICRSTSASDTSPMPLSWTMWNQIGTTTLSNDLPLPTAEAGSSLYVTFSCGSCAKLPSPRAIAPEHVSHERLLKTPSSHQAPAAATPADAPPVEDEALIANAASTAAASAVNACIRLRIVTS